MTNNDVAQLPRLPYVCDACGVQQHADGICANCGGRVRSQPSLVADNPTIPPADVTGVPPLHTCDNCGMRQDVGGICTNCGSRIRTPMEKFRNSLGFQFAFVLHSGLEVERAIDHVCASAERLVNTRATPADLTERARRLADQIIARIGEADLRPLVSDTLYMIDAATTTQRQVIRNRLAAIIVAEFTDASGTSPIQSRDLSTGNEAENQ